MANAENNYYQNLIDIYNQLNHIDTHIGDVITDNNLYHSQIVQLLQQLNGFTNGPAASPDVLAGNPWWSTNSGFALTRGAYSFVYPSDNPDHQLLFSFPQFLSKWSGYLTMPDSNYELPVSTVRNVWWYFFGSLDHSGTYNSANPYTWFDWVSDMMRSNALALAHLQAYSSQYEAEESISSLDQSTAEEFATNAPPSVDPFEIEMPPGLTGFQSVSDAFEGFINDIQPSLTDPDSRMLVLPGFDIGGIHTTPYVFDFNNRFIVPYCRAVMSFLWTVLCGAMMFRLLSGEWAYYTSLGRTTH